MKVRQQQPERRAGNISAAALLLSLAACSSLTSMADAQQQYGCPASVATADYDVVVVGAGVAGVRAAARINEVSGGQLTVAVLESTNRVGGRVRTHRGFGEDRNMMVEDGANWLYEEPPGSPPNVIYTLAQRYGVPSKTSNVRIFLPFFRSLTIGRRINAPNVAPAIRLSTDFFGSYANSIHFFVVALSFPPLDLRLTPQRMTPAF